MSYWFHAERPICHTCERGGEDLHDPENMTSNVSGMWTVALGEPMRDLSGRRLGDIAMRLRMAIGDMKGDPARFRALNPPNGWGSYESALEILETLLRWAEETPDGVLSISS